ncbi:type II toxin -antitoxin system TacA 1-like antitoxin [Paraburkholderia bannensis]|nr:DUF1778 domain-containing protein [Paraburkholderia bannensis]
MVLDRTCFSLDADNHAQLMQMLDAPPATNAGLARLMNLKAPCDRNNE